MSTTTVVPTYGRDYKSKAAVKADWDANKDFRVQDISSPWNGKAVNKADADAAGITVRIRYDGLTKVVTSEDLEAMK